jgi:riboflavin kinase/FMN adenylyltransferase
MRTVITDDFSIPLADCSIVTVGNFDGVHRGHQEIFRQVVEQARSDNATAVVVTFNPHPLRLLQPEQHRFSLLTTEEQKRGLIQQSGIDLLLIIPFTKEFAAWSARQFVRQVLHGCLNARHLVIGRDYAFGRGREGNEDFLIQIGQELGFSVKTVDSVMEDGLMFSSTAVRKLVEDGLVADAAKLLGRFYSISGQVVHGREMGRSIGFPTANISTENEQLPADGAYAVWVMLDGIARMGACSVGMNPTFDANRRTVEVFLLDFDANLYGCKLELHFVERLRGVCKFENVQALMEQIHKDVALTRKLLSNSLAPVSPQQIT